MIATDQTLSSSEVCDLLGITYRQLDHMSRRFGFTPGSGMRRRWNTRLLRELLIAKTIIDACGEWVPTTLLPAIARLIYDNPPPAGASWIAYTNGIIQYGDTPTDAATGLNGAIVARIPQDPR